MRDLNNADKLALMQVANYNCADSTCANCPYHAFVHGLGEDYYLLGCISIYLKQIADKYYTRRQND